MSHAKLFTIVAVLIFAWGSVAPLEAQANPQEAAAAAAAVAVAANSQPVVLPLVYRSPNQRVLFLSAQPNEISTIQGVLTERQLKFDSEKRFDTGRKDYSPYHLIIGGSNCMDTWAMSTEPSTFDPLERFVADGGHLLLCGTFNGNNCGHLKRFGIQTGVVHAPGFRKVKGRSEVFFQGVESTVPPDHSISSYGNFTVSGPHVMLLQRGGTTELPDAPMLATLAYKKGRVTYTQAEPAEPNEQWLLAALVKWAIRGGPTVAEQLDQEVVFDERTLVELRKWPVPVEADLFAAKQSLRDTMRADIASATLPADQLVLGDRLFQQSQKDSDPDAAFASLMLAQDFYLTAGSPAKLLETIRLGRMRYQWDGSQLALESATKLAAAIQDPVGSAELAKVCLDLADDFAEVGRYDIALSLAGLAKSAAQTAKHKHYQSLVLPFTRRMTMIQSESDRVLSFREMLKSDPKNAEANEEVGKFVCLTLQEWEVGLPQLAKGHDVTLRQLAEAEMKGTDDPNAQIIIGDLWATQAKKLPASMRPAAQSRASVWYWRALQKLSSTERASLQRKADRIFSPKFELRVSLNHTGESQLLVTKDRLHWRQPGGAAPTNVQVNSQFWPVESQSELINRGSTRYFPEEVDLQTAVVKKVRGQGTVELKSLSPEQLEINLDDLGNGEFVIKFGP